MIGENQRVTCHDTPSRQTGRQVGGHRRHEHPPQAQHRYPAGVPSACGTRDTIPMSYFRRIRFAIDPQPFLAEVAAIDGAWECSTGRQKKIKVQREALSIPLRGLRKSAIGGRKRRDVHESRWTSASKRYPLTCLFLRDFATDQDALLGRAKIVRLPAGRRVYPHVDRGEYYAMRDRFHLVLRSARGSWLKAGDEEIRMQEGELWWFDNKQLHEAFNDGDEDRIHVIFDLLPRARAAEVFGQAT